MREIKFRAWNEESKIMYGNNEVVVYLGRCWLENASFDPESIHINPSVNLVSMQFTGLKDKNGVDIYEGDIVKSYSEMIRIFAPKHQQKTGEFKTSYKVIEYRESKGSFCIAGSALSGISQKICTKYYEVAGNIFENKDLIEASK